MYKLRDEAGILKATISNIAAEKMINSSRGEFFRNTNGVTCFRFGDDYIYSIGYGAIAVNLNFWKGDVLIPE